MKNLVKRNPYPFCIAIAALVVASPLIWRQFPNPSFLIYPVVLIGVSWLIGIAATSLTNIKLDDRLPFSQLIIFFVSCFGLSFGAVWMATLPLEIAGNLWRGNVLLSNLWFALMSLVAGWIGIHAIRFLRSSPSMEAVIVIGGGVIFLTAMMWSGQIYKVPGFDIVKHIGSSFIRTEYVLYGLFEAIFWRLVFPFGMATGLLVHVFRERT